MAEPRAAPSPAALKAASAAGRDWGTVAKACADGLGELPAGANLGLLYTTGELAGDLGSILTFMRERTGIEDWVGTVGVGVAASGVEYHEQPAGAILVGALPDGLEIAARMTRYFHAAIGAQQRLTIDMREMHLFDSKTTLVVPRPRTEVGGNGP